MITDSTKGVTVEAVKKELADLEADYRARRNALRALQRVLEAERADGRVAANVTTSQRS